MGGEEHQYGIDCDVCGPEQPGLSRDDECHSDVHRVSDVAVKTFHDEGSGRCNRRGSSSTDQCEAPERGVNVDRNADGNDDDCRPFSGAVDRHIRIISEAPRYITGDGTGDDKRENCRLQYWT